MNILQKAAEILVERGYLQTKKSSYVGFYVDTYYKGDLQMFLFPVCDQHKNEQEINPFLDTLESRRQAHEIINHIIKYHIDIWAESVDLDKDMDNFDIFEFSGRRIKYCLEQLSEK